VDAAEVLNLQVLHHLTFMEGTGAGRIIESSL